jgi:hypothetical protein
MIVEKLSTAGAKLGRAPTLLEGPCSVGWDYAPLRGSDYVVLPLHTSGSVNLPEGAAFDPKAGEYRLRFNSSWHIEAVLTEFIIRKSDLDRATGQPLWRTALPSEPLQDGLCVARDGSVTVQLLDGSICCLGLPDKVPGPARPGGSRGSDDK